MGGLQSNRKPSYDANGEGIGKKLVFFCGSQNTIVELFIFSFQSILIISKYSVLLEKERLERYVRNAPFAVEKFDLFQQVAFDFNRFFFFRSASFRRRTLKPCMQ